MDLPDPLPRSELLTADPPFEHCNIQHTECTTSIHPKGNMFSRKTTAYSDIKKLQDTQRVVTSL
jgi:hypothetical protein